MAKMRDLTLHPRKENSRDKHRPEVKIFSLEEIKAHFDENIRFIQQQYAVAASLISEGNVEDGENIWRSQIVFLDSALDFFLHEITKFGLERIFEGEDEWSKTEKYNNLKVGMPYVEQAIESPGSKSWFKDYTNHEFACVPMMSYEVIKDQLNLLGIAVQEVADRAFYCRGAEEKTKDKLKRRINELYDRRNLIAHQSDRRSHNAEREPITRSDVEAFVEDTVKIVGRYAVSQPKNNKKR